MTNANTILSDTFIFNNQQTSSSHLDDVAAQVCDRWNARGDLPEDFKTAIRDGVEALDNVACDFLKTLSEIENTTDVRIAKKEGTHFRAENGDVGIAHKKYTSEQLASLDTIETLKMLTTLDVRDSFKPLIEKHGIPYNADYPANTPSQQEQIPLRITGSIIRSVINNIQKTHNIKIGFPRKEPSQEVPHSNGTNHGLLEPSQ